MHYRVLFVSNDNTYDIYCKQIYQSDLAGFIEVEDIIFQPESESLVVNPAEEKVRKEFGSVKRTFIPIYNLIRIDEVEKDGISRVYQKKSDRVAMFPGANNSHFKPKS